eukprot:9472004-Pyramimonas_sp.AAC.2
MARRAIGLPLQVLCGGRAPRPPPWGPPPWSESPPQRRPGGACLRDRDVPRIVSDNNRHSQRGVIGPLRRTSPI